MLSDFQLFSRCAACKKRKFYVSKKWIKPKNMPRVQPKNFMCNKCLSIYQKI